MLDAWSRPRDFVFPVHFTIEALQKSFPLVEVWTKLLDLVITRPCFINFISPFVKPPHLEPQLVVDGAMCEQMFSKFNEQLNVAAGFDSFQPSAVNDVGSLVPEIESPASFCESIKVLGAIVFLQLFPPNICIKRIFGKCGFKQFTPVGNEIYTFELVDVFGITA